MQIRHPHSYVYLPEAVDDSQCISYFSILEVLNLFDLLIVRMTKISHIILNF